MDRLPIFLALLLLGIGSAHAAPALRLSTTLSHVPAAVIAPPPPAADPVQLKFSGSARISLGSLVLDKAMAMLGTDYRLGSNSDEAVDCSALAQQVFRSAGLELPRTSNELLETGTAVRKAQLKPGDLLIYRWSPRRLRRTGSDGVSSRCTRWRT